MYHLFMNIGFEIAMLFIVFRHIHIEDIFIHKYLLRNRWRV